MIDNDCDHDYDNEAWGLPIAIVVVVVIDLLRSLSAFQTSTFHLALHDQGVALAPADAQRGQAQLVISVLHFMQQGGQDPAS